MFRQDRGIINKWRPILKTLFKMLKWFVCLSLVPYVFTLIGCTIALGPNVVCDCLITLILMTNNTLGNNILDILTNFYVAFPQELLFDTGAYFLVLF